jgi:STE24 endopeptidase
MTGFMIFMYFIETYLDLRQHTALKLPHLPKPLKGVVSQDKFEKSRAYSIDKRFAIFLCYMSSANDFLK